MRKLLVMIGAMTLSTSALADISTGNEDLQGWAVEDQNLQSVKQMTVQETQPPFGTSDQYGGVLFTPGSQSTSPPAAGVGDSYGSVLHEIGFDH